MDSYDAMDMAALKGLAKERGIKAGSTVGKATLVGRLREYDAAQGAQSPGGEGKAGGEADVISLINESVDDFMPGAAERAARGRGDDTILMDEEIPVRSVTLGGVTWISPKTNAHYRWNEIGSVEYMPFGELVTMNNTKRAFLFKPMVILLDERAVRYFRLQETYEKVAQIHSLKAVFDSGDLSEISRVLDTIVRVNMRDVAISKIRDMRRTGELVNIDVIRLVEGKLCFDLSDEPQAR